MMSRVATLCGDRPGAKLVQANSNFLKKVLKKVLTYTARCGIIYLPKGKGDKLK